uniref:SET domain-containing protein n=1 Tax=Branchiostoma floridae TaxID=7739 RepID=C3Y414_BRAFL|eukprot:XP_002609030.1 hypothetical protein BRAFLDRAFT_84846 [Branchiostoma floridae]
MFRSPYVPKSPSCDHCMRSMEPAEAMSRRLANSPSLVLPFPQCCAVKLEQHVTCPHCQKYTLPSRNGQYHDDCQNDSHGQAACDHCMRSMETAEAMSRRLANSHSLVLPFPQCCAVKLEQHVTCPHCQDQLELLRGLLTEALYEESLDQWFTPDGFRSIFAMIGRNGQGIGTSSLSVYVHNCDALELPSQDREKLDAFIDQLYVDMEHGNHSCEPTAEPSFDESNYVLSMRALRDITEGEELFICYLDECERTRSRHSRQKLLRENYLFSCTCEKCTREAEDPDVTSSEEEEDEGDGESDEQ